MRTKLDNALKTKYDLEKNLVHIWLSGPLDESVILEAFERAVSNPDYRPGMGRLWDFRAADLSALNYDKIYELGQYSLTYPEGFNDVKVALLTGSDLEFGYCRMFEMTSVAKTPIGVFKDLVAAQEYLMAAEAQ